MNYDKTTKKITSERALSELDKFAMDFIKIIEKHVSYVIISGYVSIILGRSRSSEDIDIFIKKISRDKFEGLYQDLINDKFWCLNSGNIDDLYSYLQDGLAIRFAYKGEGIPNFEVKFPKDFIDEEVFEDSITVQIGDFSFFISSLEKQIAFKKYYLGDDKDLEDAKHIEELFNKDLDMDKIEETKKLIAGRNGH
jgi:predicted nucleotidyltransferase